MFVYERHLETDKMDGNENGKQQVVVACFKRILAFIFKDKKTKHSVIIVNIAA
jgi:hypothetical protein